MREGGKILGNLLRDLKDYVKPGMTGKEIDAWVRKEIVARGAGVAYDMLEERFPGAICISINDQLKVQHLLLSFVIIKRKREYNVFANERHIKRQKMFCKE